MSYLSKQRETADFLIYLSNVKLVYTRRANNSECSDTMDRWWHWDGADSAVEIWDDWDGGRKNKY